MVRFTVLGSGSGGNCSYVEAGGTRLLIDAGFSAKQIGERLATIGRSLDDIDAILLTHEHGDHVAGLPVLCRRLERPLYCNRDTARALEGRMPEFKNWRWFQTGQSFGVGDVQVESFPVPHDAMDPVGFVLQHGGVRIGFVTDLGHATKLVVDRMRRCQVLLLESNYDQTLLHNDTKRPWSVKQRIMSRHGHLSNDGAARLIEEVMSDELELLLLGHLSQDCNSPDLALATTRAMLDHLQVTHVAAHVTLQEQASPCFALKARRALELYQPELMVGG